MNNGDRCTVLRTIDKFADNYRIAANDRERKNALYLGYGFIETMTFDESERQDFKGIFRNKIGIRDLEAFSLSAQ